MNKEDIKISDDIKTTVGDKNSGEHNTNNNDNLKNSNKKKKILIHLTQILQSQNL